MVDPPQRSNGSIWYLKGPPPSSRRLPSPDPARAPPWPHPRAPAAQLNAVTPTAAEVLAPGDDDEEEAAAPPQPPATTTRVQPCSPSSRRRPPPRRRRRWRRHRCRRAGTPAAPRGCACAALLRWKTRVSLLLLFVCSSLASLCVLVASATRNPPSSVQLEVLPGGCSSPRHRPFALSARRGSSTVVGVVHRASAAFPRTSACPCSGE